MADRRSGTAPIPGGSGPPRADRRSPRIIGRLTGLDDGLLLAIGLVMGLFVGSIVAGLTGFIGWPSAAGASATGGAATSGSVPASIHRLAVGSTVSVDSKGCAGPLAGSGVVVRGGLLITAAHVAGGAEHVTVASGSGTTEAHPVLVAPGFDVASAPVPTSWPTVAEASTDPATGAPVVVATRARGDLQIRAAHVDGYVNGTGPDDPAKVMRLDVTVAPGDSGGPVLDSHGRLVGIVYAEEHGDDRGLVIPVSELSSALALDGSIATC